MEAARRHPAGGLIRLDDRRNVVLLETSTHVPAAPDQVWAWWTDYGAEGASERVSHGVGRSERRVLLAEGDRVVIEERLPLPLGGRARLVTHELRLFPDERRILECDLDHAYESTWRFEPDGEGTRVSRAVKVRGRIAHWGAPVLAPVARAFVQRDLEAHARQFAASRGTRPAPDG